MKRVCPSLGEERLVCTAFSEGRISSGWEALLLPVPSVGNTSLTESPLGTHCAGLGTCPLGTPSPELWDRGLCGVGGAWAGKDQANTTEWEAAACILQQLWGGPWQGGGSRTRAQSHPLMSQMGAQHPWLSSSLGVRPHPQSQELQLVWSS